MAKISLVTDQDYLTQVLKLISKAKKSIDIISFSFAIGSNAGKYNEKSAPFKIALKLKEIQEKNKGNIKVRFFTEGVRETNERNRLTAKYLAAAGAKVKFGATHAKGFCIDSRYVLFGSTNLTNQSIAKNHEANVLLDDKLLAKEFLKYFEHLWKGGKHGKIKLDPPFYADGDFKDSLIELIDSAKKSIDFSIYFFNHKEIEKALIRAADRGLKITGFIHQHASFALPYIWANRSTVKRLKASGITDIYWGRPFLFSHSKYLVTDRKNVALGTGNWLVEDVNEHPQLYFITADKKLAAGFIKHLHHQIDQLT
jgi:phosphatidylserine/phosphatidylglycerophosphate/cardiolipin synthase-like enzyme